MRQVIPFVKDLDFKTNIYEVTSIALEHNLKLENNDSVVGEFKVNGKYRINDLSINEEDFVNSIPIDITLDDKYDASSMVIDIDNFYYEIINDDILRVHIDVLLDNLNYLKEDVKKPELKIKEEKKVIIPDEILDNEKRNNEEDLEEKTDDKVVNLTSNLTN